MKQWRRTAPPRFTYAPIALRLVDDFTAQAPIAQPKVVLDIETPSGWQATGILPTRTPSNLIAYTGLGKEYDPAAIPSRRYRVRVDDSERPVLYVPSYAFTIDGLEFDVASWNDVHPPAFLPNRPEVVYLWPGPTYPFPSSVRVLHGRALDGLGSPLRYARISAGMDHVLTDSRGVFALPVRLTAPASSLLVDAEHDRSGVSASQMVPLPAGLGRELQLSLT
jgi:hypothetical protein